VRLIISQYLRSLKERDEFDALLPDLLLAMGYVPVSKPQTGVRQFGVDLAVCGEAEDGTKELLLLVIKQGDITRNNWDSGPQAVRQSLNEVFDVYLRSHVDQAHQKYKKRVILATTGDLRQDTQPNWDGYTHDNADKAEFDFWGGDRVADLVEKYLLNENLFKEDDRKDLRKALALAGTVDYDQKDLHRLLIRQLGLTQQGELAGEKMSGKKLVKGIRVASLTSQIFARWSAGEGNLKQAVIAAERALLWVWHRIELDASDSMKFFEEFAPVAKGYFRIADEYYRKIQGHLYVKDGLSGYSRENASFALNVFEHIGLIASIGLAHLMIVAINKDRAEAETENAKAIANGLISMMRNNPVSGSPRLDENVVDISLGFLFLVTTGNVASAKEWLTELAQRVDFTLRVGRNFPICTDSLDDLVELTVFNDEVLSKRLMEMSWMLPTLAGWAALLNHEEVYRLLAKHTKAEYPEICLQLWHPTEDVFQHLYFHNSCRYSGESEVPISLPESMDEYRDQMKQLMGLSKFDVLKFSPGFRTGLGMIDFIACRHFRTPVPPYLCYKAGGLISDKDEAVESDAK